MAQSEISDLSETDSSNVEISDYSLDGSVANMSTVDNVFQATMGMLKRWFKSSLFRLRDSTDQTKLLALDLSAITTATTRTLAVQDKNGTIALTTDVLTSGTPQVTTSGTSIDFTGIPAGRKQIIITLVGVSTNGVSPPIIQIGDSGGVETTGYNGTGGTLNSAGTAAANWSIGFGLSQAAWGAAQVIEGTLTLTLADASTNTWVASGTMALSSTAQLHFTAGSKSLSAALDRIRLTTSAGTDAFDAGAINIVYQ